MQAGSTPGPLLRDARLRRILGAYAVSRLGDKLYNVAQVVVVLRLTGSPGWASAVLVAHSLPYVLVKPLAGVLVDRVDRRRLMMGCDLGRAVLQVAFALLVVLHAAPWTLLVLAFATTAVGAPHLSALSALLPDLVPENRLAAVNAAIAGLTYVAIVAGPLVAALVLTHADDSAAFLLNAVTFVVSAVLIRGPAGEREPGERAPEEPRQREPEPPAEGFWTALRAGVRDLTGDQIVRPALVLVLGGAFVYGLCEVLLALVGRDLLGIGDAGLGWLTAATGVGGVLGAGVAARAARQARLIAVMGVAAVCCALPLAALAGLHAVWAACLVLALSGLGSVTIDVAIATTLQRAIPRNRLGRVHGLVSSAGYLSLIGGNLAAPALIAGLGLRGALVAGSGLVVVPSSVLLVTGGNRRLQPAAPDVLAVLRRIPSLRGLEEPALEALAAAAGDAEPLPSGTVLLREGDPAREVLLLVSGACDVLVAGPGEQPRLVNQVAGPDLLGEIGVLHRRPRTATVRATSDCQVRRVPAADVEAALRRAVALPGALDDTVSARLARGGG